MVMVTWKNLECPKVFCDWCEEEITEAADGNYERLPWENGKRMKEPWHIYFTHKRCCRPFETAHGRGSGAQWHSMELAYFPIYLGNNLHLDWDDARSGAQSVAHM